MKSKKDFEQLKLRAEKGLDELLNFYIKYDKDPNGGFFGRVGRDLIPDKDADRSLVHQARIMWTFASAYRVLGDRKYLDASLWAMKYIQEHFWDKVYGGGYWGVHADGTPADTNKYTYGNSFIIYGAAELARAAGNEEAKKMAIDTYQLMEKYALDKMNDGYFEAYDRQWNRLERNFENLDPAMGTKVLNTHLHLIESYTNLLRVWNDKELRGKVRELIEIMSNKMLDREIFHYNPYMTDDWKSTVSLVSYGHDIEGAWLLIEAAQTLGDMNILEASKPVAVRIADSCANGLDPTLGGMYSEVLPSGEIDKKMIWWVQAEAVVGFLNAWQITNDDKHWDNMLRVWDYIDRFVIDREGGIYRDWISNSSLSANDPKNHFTVNGWKTPYHNGRMYMEIIERMEALL